MQVDWHNNNVQTDELRLTLVNFDKVNYKEEPYVMAFQEKQVLYINDPSQKGWSEVFRGKNIHNSRDGNQ